MNFSVIIPSKNVNNLIPCVEAVRKHEPGARIIVVDDGIPDSAKIASPLNRCEFIEGISPFVFSRNVNLGICHAMEVRVLEVTTVSDEYRRYLRIGDTGVVLLNDDALLQTPNGFSRLAELAEQHQDIGIIAPVTNVTGQPLQMPRNVGLRQVPHIAFVCVYIPRRTIERIGMLDERYCLDYGVEDRDYCEAVNRAGLKVCVYDHVFVDHGSLISSFRGDPKQPKSYDRNLALFKAKWNL